MSAAEHTAPRTTLERITAAPGCGDVRLTATIDGDAVRVVARMVGLANRWREPRADVVRVMADALAVKHGHERAGRRQRTATQTGWLYLFPLR